MRLFHFTLLASLLMTSAACSPLGMATGAGAAVGVASQQEGGISGAAEDLRIKARISDLWFRYNVSMFAKLNLTVKQGRVLITGIVQNPDDRVEAVRLAWQIDGVTQVINEIHVADGQGLPGFVSDEWITTRLRAQLTFDADVRSINYSIDTVQGAVYLMGYARSQAELDRVIEIARTIPHVQQVVSYVKLPSDVPAAVNPSPAQPQLSTTTTTTTQTYTAPASSPVTLPPPADNTPFSSGSAANPAPVTRTVLPP